MSTRTRRQLKHYLTSPNDKRLFTADLAAQLAAGLGLNVVSAGRGPGTEEKEAAQTEANWAVGGDAELLMAEEEEEEEAGGESAAARLGGWFDDGQNTSRRVRTRAIRREEKEGKDPEKVGEGRWQAALGELANGTISCRDVWFGVWVGWLAVIPRGRLTARPRCVRMFVVR